MTAADATSLSDADFRYLYLTDADGADQTQRLVAEWAQITPPARRYQAIENYVSGAEDGLAICDEPKDPDATGRLMAMVSAHIDAQP